MAIQRPQLVNGEIYHVVLRAVGDYEVFKNTDDYYRGVFSIYEFNNKNFIEIRERRKERKKEKNSGGPTPVARDVFLEVLAFSLMPNHVHLLVRQLKDNGISQYMQKLGGGYASYFNRKYNRKGHLFNKFRAIPIETNEQLQNVFVYIHTNRISIIEPGWKEKGIENPKKVIDFLENDKWHSYSDYLGKKNFPSVTDREFLLGVMDSEQGCRDFVNNWIEHKKEIRDLGDAILE